MIDRFTNRSIYVWMLPGGPSLKSAAAWVRYAHPNRLTPDNTVLVVADDRFFWLADGLWHILVRAFPAVALKIGFEVGTDMAKKGYRVGYLPKRGDPMVFNQVQHALRYWMMIGGTACEFFAVDADDNPIPLRKNGSQPTRTPPKDEPLL
jgi:hypothetical protein